MAEPLAFEPDEEPLEFTPDKPFVQMRPEDMAFAPIDKSASRFDMAPREPQLAPRVAMRPPNTEMPASALPRDRVSRFTGYDQGPQKPIVPEGPDMALEWANQKASEPLINLREKLHLDDPGVQTALSAISATQPGMPVTPGGVLDVGTDVASGFTSPKALASLAVKPLAVAMAAEGIVASPTQLGEIIEAYQSGHKEELPEKVRGLVENLFMTGFMAKHAAGKPIDPDLFGDVTGADVGGRNLPPSRPKPMAPKPRPVEPGGGPLDWTMEGANRGIERGAIMERSHRPEAPVPEAATGGPLAWTREEAARPLPFVPDEPPPPLSINAGAAQPRERVAPPIRMTDEVERANALEAGRNVNVTDDPFFAGTKGIDELSPRERPVPPEPPQQSGFVDEQGFDPRIIEDFNRWAELRTPNRGEWVKDSFDRPSKEPMFTDLEADAAPEPPPVNVRWSEEIKNAAAEVPDATPLEVQEAARQLEALDRKAAEGQPAAAAEGQTAVNSIGAEAPRGAGPAEGGTPEAGGGGRVPPYVAPPAANTERLPLEQPDLTQRSVAEMRRRAGVPEYEGSRFSRSNQGLRDAVAGNEEALVARGLKAKPGEILSSEVQYALRQYGDRLSREGGDPAEVLRIAQILDESGSGKGRELQALQTQFDNIDHTDPAAVTNLAVKVTKGKLSIQAMRDLRDMSVRAGKMKDLSVETINKRAEAALARLEGMGEEVKKLTVKDVLGCP